MRTPVLTPVLPIRPLPLLPARVVKVPRSSSRVQSPVTPYSSFSQSRQPHFFISPPGSAVVHRHSLPLFFSQM